MCTGKIMKCAVMQPAYLPWMGYFDLIQSVDCFVFLDDVKVEKSSWQTHNRLAQKSGEYYLSVPVLLPDRSKTQIRNALIDYSKNWTRKHLVSLKQSYGKSPFFDQCYPCLEKIIRARHDNLADLNIRLIQALCRMLDTNVRFCRSSDMPEISGHKDGRLVSICESLGCETYLSPVGAASYMEKDSPGGALAKAGIALRYQNFSPLPYPQRCADFLPRLSIVDALMNCGTEKTCELIRRGHNDPFDFKSIREIYPDLLK